MGDCVTGRVLVLGVSGMLGHTVFRVFSENGNWQTFGTARDERIRQQLPQARPEAIITGVDVGNVDALFRAFARARPSLVINCVGVIKQSQAAQDASTTIPVNALLPHRLAALCGTAGARLIHVSTDCVFSGRTGNYVEGDTPDADDLYGRSKLLGEVAYPHTVTLRTSIIGPELDGGAHGLVGWFLAQQRSVKGYAQARFSGLPTVTLARLMRDVVATSKMHGLYHVGAAAIDKLSLLRLVREVYAKDIEIIPDDGVVIDRSLNSDRFCRTTGYESPPWPELVREMRSFG